MKIKKIIIEGADQQGKSSLCAFLKKQLGWRVKHYPPPSRTFNFVDGYFLDDNSISDRNFMSELVYSRLRPNIGCRITNLNAILEHHKDTLLILCDRGNMFLFDERDEQYTEAQIREARDLYRYEYEKLDMQKMVYNPHSNESNKRIIELIQKIKHNEDY